MALQRIEPARFTRYMGQCLRKLENSAEYESDLMLVHLVRTQKLSDRIAALKRDDFIDDLPGIPQLPLGAYYQKFQRDLDDAEARLPSRPRTNPYLMMHLRTGTLRLWEPPPVDSSLGGKLCTSFTQLALASPSMMDIFYNSGAALRRWFETWFEIPLAQYPYLPMAASAQLVHAITLLSRWAKLSSGGIGRGSGRSSPRDESLSGGLEEAVVWPVINTDGLTPSVARVLAAISAQMSQPGLQLDVLAILRCLIVLFDEVKSLAGETSSDPDSAMTNHVGSRWWDVVSSQCRVALYKLERFSCTSNAEGSPTAVMVRGSDGGIHEGWSSSDNDFTFQLSTPSNGMDSDQTFWQLMDSALTSVPCTPPQARPACTN
jgi:hypothetical protein